MKLDKEALKEKASTAASKAKDIAVVAKDKGGAAVKKGSEAVKTTSMEAYKKAVAKIDANGNGEVDIEDIIINSLKLPGIQIDRDSFLKKELKNVCSEEEIKKAIATSPLEANIDPEVIHKLVDETIAYERNCVSGISAALGIPGGAAMIATIPADIIQYYGYMLRAAQKLMYLYGFPEIIVDDNQTQLDTTTINTLTLCLGVMYGVNGANTAIKAMAKALAEGVPKQLMKKALTKGTIYPIVKSVAKWFNVKMTKEVFAGFFKKAIPVIGGVVGAGITYATFKPCCDKLKASLEDTALSNPNFKPVEGDILFQELDEGIDALVEEVEK